MGYHMSQSFAFHPPVEDTQQEQSINNEDSIVQ